MRLRTTISECGGRVCLQSDSRKTNELAQSFTYRSCCCSDPTIRRADCRGLPRHLRNVQARGQRRRDAGSVPSVGAHLVTANILIHRSHRQIVRRGAASPGWPTRTCSRRVHVAISLRTVGEKSLLHSSTIVGQFSTPRFWPKSMAFRFSQISLKSRSAFRGTSPLRALFLSLETN
jgi:hypothetical protein